MNRSPDTTHVSESTDAAKLTFLKVGMMRYMALNEKLSTPIKASEGAPTGSSKSKSAIFSALLEETGVSPSDIMQALIQKYGSRYIGYVVVSMKTITFNGPRLCLHHALAAYAASRGIEDQELNASLKAAAKTPPTKEPRTSKKPSAANDSIAA